MACDRLWELYVLIDAQDEATRDTYLEMTEQFSRTVRADGFFGSMVTEFWIHSTDGTLIQYMVRAKPCQGCERRYVQGPAKGSYPLAAESKYKLLHCTCGLTQANIKWALKTEIFVDSRRRNRNGCSMKVHHEGRV